MTILNALRFPSPLIKPDVRISRIRLSDRVHRKAHGGALVARVKTLHAEFPEDFAPGEHARASSTALCRR